MNKKQNIYNRNPLMYNDVLKLMFNKKRVKND